MCSIEYIHYVLFYIWLLWLSVVCELYSYCGHTTFIIWTSPVWSSSHRSLSRHVSRHVWWAGGSVALCSVCFLSSRISRLTWTYSPGIYTTRVEKCQHIQASTHGTSVSIPLALSMESRDKIVLFQCCLSLFLKYVVCVDSPLMPCLSL